LPFLAPGAKRREERGKRRLRRDVETLKE
jgi:hypothetical protein